MRYIKLLKWRAQKKSWCTFDRSMRPDPKTFWYVCSSSDEALGQPERLWCKSAALGEARLTPLPRSRPAFWHACSTQGFCTGGYRNSRWSLKIIRTSDAVGHVAIPARSEHVETLVQNPSKTTTRIRFYNSNSNSSSTYALVGCSSLSLQEPKTRNNYFVRLKNFYQANNK